MMEKQEQLAMQDLWAPLERRGQSERKDWQDILDNLYVQIYIQLLHQLLGHVMSTVGSCDVNVGSCDVNCRVM